MGGEILSVEVSAKKRLNLDVLEETILLQAEIADLKANPNRLAYGAVVEAKQKKVVDLSQPFLFKKEPYACR